MQVIYSIITILAMCLGFYFGFKIGRTNELPKLKTKKELVKEEEKEKKKNALERALDNLDKYDGTSKGQEEII